MGNIVIYLSLVFRPWFLVRVAREYFVGRKNDIPSDHAERNARIAEIELELRNNMGLEERRAHIAFYADSIITKSQFAAMGEKEQTEFLRGGGLVDDDTLSEERQVQIKRIYEGTETEQAGQAWIESEMSDPAYTGGVAIEDGRFHHEMINEPQHGAELPCYWNSNIKAWEPVYPWPDILRQTEPDLAE
jgi:hypothetical protein